MPTLKEVNENLKIISTLKEIVLAYQEIANLKIRETRELVLKNREFFQELLKTYQTVAQIYGTSEKKGQKERKEKIAVFLSANQPFYGSLILEIWKEAQSFLFENRMELLVIGRIGKILAQESKLVEKFFYFDLNIERIEKGELAKIVDFLKNYQTIFVFHGKYETLLKQIPVREEIGKKLFTKEEKLEKESYIFEPSPEAILDFFEKEIIGTLFHHTLLEHQLALNGARAMAMYEAGEKAKTQEKKLILMKNRLKKEIINKKIIEMFSLRTWAK